MKTKIVDFYLEFEDEELLFDTFFSKMHIFEDISLFSEKSENLYINENCDIFPHCRRFLTVSPVSYGKFPNFQLKHRKKVTLLIILTIYLIFQRYKWKVLRKWKFK